MLAATLSSLFLSRRAETLARAQQRRRAKETKKKKTKRKLRVC
jgi:hypothetical protein